MVDSGNVQLDTMKGEYDQGFKLEKRVEKPDKANNHVVFGKRFGKSWFLL